MVKYKILNVNEKLHKALKVQAAKHERTIIEELEFILKNGLEEFNE